MRLIIIAASLMLTLPVIIVMGYNYYVDPYQYYRIWSGSEPIFSTKGRYQNPGLIKHYDYDTIIIGTSRSQNFTPDMFAKSKWKVIKLTASGSGSYVHGKTIKNALETGKVKRVIIELSSSAYQFGPRHLRQGKAFPEFLYDPTIETPFLYLLSYDLFKKSKRVLKGKKTSSTLGELNVWQHRYEQDFGKNSYLENIDLDCHPLDPIPEDWKGDYPLMDQALEENLEPFLEGYPDVEFLGFLPPYPISWFGQVSEEQRRVRFGFRHRVYGLGGRYSNFRVFDFALMKEVVGNPSRYKDFNHYDQSTNLAMAKALTTGTWQTTESDPSTANRQLKAIADAFDWSRWTACSEPDIGSGIASTL